MNDPDFATVRRVGVVSDTHGLVRPEALEALEGCRLILHAGDVGGADVLSPFRGVAPVVAVRGNVDRGPYAQELPRDQLVQAGGRTFYVLHNMEELDLDPEAAGIDVVVHGHTHRPARDRRGSVLYLNPGSIGPRRFDLPVALALVHLEEGSVRVESRELDVG